MSPFVVLVLGAYDTHSHRFSYVQFKNPPCLLQGKIRLQRYGLRLNVKISGAWDHGAKQLVVGELLFEVIQMFRKLSLRWSASSNGRQRTS